ncbi:MAG: hypothetical protein IJE43_19380 [Alphaproteobacteria bacterium]|nr:hypothetical protein [Alphaproteobacteria bacterium]
MTEIELKFEEAKSLTDVFNLMRQLRADGFNSTEVNNAAAKRKRAIIVNSRGNFTSKLVKVVPPLDNNDGVPLSGFKVSVAHFKDNTIVLKGDTVEL